MKKLFSKIKCRMTAKGAARLAKHQKEKDHQRMAQEEYEAAIAAYNEAAATSRAANGTTDQPRSILG